MPFNISAINLYRMPANTMKADFGYFVIISGGQAGRWLLTHPASPLNTGK